MKLIIQALHRREVEKNISYKDLITAEFTIHIDVMLHSFTVIHIQMQNCVNFNSGVEMFTAKVV